MGISMRTSKGLMVVKFSEPVEPNHLAYLNSALEELPNLESLILDFAKVGLMGSKLVSFLVKIEKRFPRDYPKIKIANPNETVREVLQITHLNQVFDVFHNHFSGEKVS